MTTRKNKVKELSYKERQVAHLCGCHAFNHVLQEQKLVWLPNKPLLVIGATSKAAGDGASAKDPDVKINAWAFCKTQGLAHLRAQREEYLELDAARIIRNLADEPNLNSPYYKEAGRAKDFDRDLMFWKENMKKFGMKSKAEIIAILDKEMGQDETLEQLEEGGIGCTMSGPSRGDIPYAWFRRIFEMLGYDYLETDDLTWKKDFRTAIKDKTYLGMVINQGKWHYVSAPKYVMGSDCPSYKFALADSLDKDIFECHGKRDLYRATDSLPLTRAFFLFARDAGAYESVALKRMRKKLGRKKYTRRM